MMIAPQLIEKIRKDKGISKEEVAQAAGMRSDAHAYDTYIGRAKVLDSMILPYVYDIANILGVSIDDLINPQSEDKDQPTSTRAALRLN